MRSSDFFDRHPVFTHHQFVSTHTATGRSPNTSNSLLRKHVAAGRILRVRRGLYAVVPRGVDPASAPLDPYLIASALTADAVVAYHAALQFHGRVYSVSHRFHYLTCARARPYAFRGANFVPVRVPEALRKRSDLGGGIRDHLYAGGSARVTTLERTLVDVLDAPDKGAGWEEVWRSLEQVEFFDLDAVIDYAQKLGSAIAAARVGFFLEQHRDTLMVEEAHLDALKRLGPGEPRYFDPRRQSGKLVTRWNLVVPEAILSRNWEAVL